MNELLVFFKDPEVTRNPVRAHLLFARGASSPTGVRLRSARYARLRSPTLRLTPVGEDGWCRQAESCFANYTTCPVLLAPRQTL